MKLSRFDAEYHGNWVLSGGSDFVVGVDPGKSYGIAVASVRPSGEKVEYAHQIDCSTMQPWEAMRRILCEAELSGGVVVAVAIEDQYFGTAPHRTIIRLAQKSGATADQIKKEIERIGHPKTKISYVSPKVWKQDLIGGAPRSRGKEACLAYARGILGDELDPALADEVDAALIAIWRAKKFRMEMEKSNGWRDLANGVPRRRRWLH